MRQFIKYIFKITFYILIINSFIYLTAFSQTNLENIFVDDFSTNQILKRQFSKERQLLSVNLLPNISAIYPTFVNSLFKNIETFSGLAKMDISGIKKYLDLVELKGSFWYIPNISYTILLNRVIGIELGIGVQSVTYSLNIPKNNIPALLGRDTINMGGANVKIVDILKGENEKLKASFVYIPIHIGLKIISGRTHKTVNTFRLGLETVVYNVETENIFTGIKTKRSTTDATVYISYELGWQIDLFPNKNWRVKPYIDFSLFEIGFYLRSAMRGVYGDIKEGISLATSLGEFSGYLDFDINQYIPEWNTFPKAVGVVTSLKIAIFPRVGFTIRF